MNNCDNNVSLRSQIVNEKKELYLNVTQTMDFVLINQFYEYTVYVKNISHSVIDDLKVFVLNQKAISINSDYPDEDFYENIGSLQPGESRLFKLKARCTQSGYYNTTFVAYSSGSEIESVNTFITCGLVRYVPETYHRLSIFNFDPYEEGYWLSASDYNDQVTQLTKVQNRPWKEKEGYYNQFLDYELDLYDQDIELVNKDNLPITHLGREVYIYNEKEHTPGDGIRNLVDRINKESQLIHLDLLRIGNNQFENRFIETTNTSMMDKFGLLRSEIYHVLGVIPTFGYSVDGLFRWARENDYLANHIYPPLNDYFWNTKKWSGYGYTIDEIYIDKERDEYERYPDVAFFETLEDAQDYIQDQESLNFIKNGNVYDENNELIKGYYYNIHEVLDSEGIFFIYIPYDEIPANFFRLTDEELQPIIDKTKPFGLKPVLRYVFKNSFHNYMGFRGYPIRKPHIHVDIPSIKRVIPHATLFNYLTDKKWIYEYSKDLVNKMTVNMKKAAQNNSLSLDITHTIEPTPFLTSVYSRLYQKSVAFPMISVTNSEDVSFYRKASDTLTYIIDKKLTLPPTRNISSYYEILQNENANFKFNNSRIDYDYKTTEPDTDDTLIRTYFSIEYVTLTGRVYVQLIDKKTSNPITNQQFSYSINNQAPQTAETDDSGFANIYLSGNKNDAISNNYSLDLIIETDEIYHGSVTSAYFTTRPNTCTYYLLFNNLSDNIEKSFIFKDDINNQYHIFSSEYLNNEHKHILSYKKWKNTSVDTVKGFSIDKDKADGIACEVYPLAQDNIMIIFYLYQNKQLHYLTHITIGVMSDSYIAIRNTGIISKTMQLDLRESLLYSTGSDNNTDLVYNVPQYQKMISTDEYDYTEQVKSNNLSWNKLYRINEEVESYAYVTSNENNKAINDIQLYIPNCNVPDMSTVKGIYVKTLMSGESTITASLAYNINHSTDNTDKGLILDSHNVNFYRQMSSNYINYLMELDQLNNDRELLDLHKNEFNKAQSFNNQLQANIEKDKVLITGDYWTELIFKNKFDISLSDVSSINLLIEGYNNNDDITLQSELCTLLDGYGISDTTIYSGYFYEKIPLKITSKGIINDFFVRLRFKTLKDVELFNYKLEINFLTNQKQNIIDVTEDNTRQYKIKSDDYQRVKLNSEDLLGAFINNGLIVNLGFSNINKGDIVKAYAINIEIEYQDNDSTLVTEKILNDPVVLAGNSKGYIGGMFYDEKPSTSQRLYVDFYNNRRYPGFKIKDKVYQSFTANDPNITSINVMPNGYSGQPDQNLKISLYDDKNGVPNKCLKTIYVDGWRDKFQDSKTINYNFNIDNLDIDHRYWFCFEQKDKTFDGYYYLKGSPNDFEYFKILYENDDNLIDADSSLWFEVLSSDHVESFKSFSACQMDPNIDKPYIILKINNTIGEVSNLVIRS